MIRKSAHQQSSSLGILAFVFAALLLPGAAAIAQSTAPAITSGNSATFGVSSLGSFTVTTTGSPTPVITAAGPLPGGVDFQDNGDGTASLGGTPAANGIFNITLTASNGVAPDATQSFTLTVNAVSAISAARFLEQSSWGPTATTIAQVQQAGLQTFLQQQFNAPITNYPTPGAGQSLAVVQNQFFVNAMQGQDQLRQRVSFALSEIMVISGMKSAHPNDIDPSEFTLWMNMLQNDSFGNFYNLLNDVTISPSMGYYLDMANNNGCTKCTPNENYAREILQLFSIGLNQLNIDGTPVLDQNGDATPTYSQSTIEGFAGLFTGWSYPPNTGTAHFSDRRFFGGPMLPFQKNYYKPSKLLLSGITIPAAGNIQTDLNSGLQNIFNHPNVAPFICQQLIQKLVTSNPSPDYVSRVAQVFKNDGNGVAGNLEAVVTQILLDPEARRGDDPSQVQASDGHLREPLLQMLAAMRAVNATTDGANLTKYATTLLQPPFLSPSVFNFYPPNYQVPDTQLLGPEFKILNANTTISRVNFINDLIYGSVGPHTTTDISAYVNAGGNVGNLLDMVNTNLMHGEMPSDMYSTIFSALSSGAFTDNTSTAKAALYLVETSNQFQMEH